jgi:penicillin-binding protein 1A
MLVDGIYRAILLLPQLHWNCMHRFTSTRALAVLAALAVTASGCAQLQDLPRLTRKDLRFRPPETSLLFDSSGRVLRSFHGEQNRTVVRLSRIPRHVQRAVIAIEDERFYEHDGVDYRAIARALVANIESGGISEGGSTITQQYVKNVIISPGAPAEQTIERKIDEAALARQVEERLSKKEILERYLNTVYFGGGAYGIQAAAGTFFGKPVNKLSLTEGALLAGLIKSPGEFNPYRTPKEARRRRNLVLTKLEELGWAKPGKVQRARSSRLGLKRSAEGDRYPAPYFVDYVTRLIKYDPRFRVLGRTSAVREKRLFTGGLRIYTTIDLEMQEAAEQAVAGVLTEPSDPHGSLVAIDPKTGYVKAMVGGRNFFAKKKQNRRFAKLNLAIAAEPALGRVVDSRSGKVVNRAPGTGRQAGSSFKPFALIAALMNGVSLAERFPGPSMKIFPGLSTNGEPWEVHNYGDAGFGTLSLLEATINSVNTVYAQLIVDVGPSKVVEVAERMGINTPLNPYYSSVLGSNEVNPLDMASAFATLANYGTYRPPVAITRIVDSTTGKVLYVERSKPQEAIPPGVAYLATTALENVITSGTGTAALNYLGGRPAAGKTGTAQEYQDAWFTGYTPDLAAAVWVGYPSGAIEMLPYCPVTHQTLPNGVRQEICRPTRIQVTGGSWPTEIWGAFMARALANTPATDFEIPEDANLVAITIDSRTGCLAVESAPDQFKVTQYFAPGTAPTETCPVPGDEDGDGRVDPQEKAVPSVLGYVAGEAEDLLEGKGFKVDVVVEPESNKGQAKKNSGKVWKQAPGSGTELEEGATVTVWVNP